jgi:hypothetical protein
LSKAKGKNWRVGGFSRLDKQMVHDHMLWSDGGFFETSGIVRAEMGRFELRIEMKLRRERWWILAEVFRAREDAVVT